MLRSSSSRKYLVVVLGIACLYSVLAFAEGDALDSYDARRDFAWEALRAEPYSVDRGNAGGLARTVPNAALAMLWLDQDVDAANEMLGQYAEALIADRATRNDQHSIYWSAELTVRIVEFFGREGSVAPGRLEAEVEDWLLELMWLFAMETSYVDSLEELREFYAETDAAARQAVGDPMPVSANIIDTRTWDVIESENHHAMTWMTLWDFTRLLKDRPAYADRLFRDGHTAAQHYEAWTLYAQEYCRQRARKGLFVEMADGTYNSFTLKGLYNLLDFAEEPVTRALAERLLTLYYASWAQEQLGGVRGGGKSRMNSDKDRRSTTAVARSMWYYTGIGSFSKPYGGRLALMTSDYRLPELVARLATSPEHRGEYEVRDRPLGLAEAGQWTNPLYRLRTDYGGIIRYSWCTPDFIMGLPMLPIRKLTNWTKISSQGRWQGVIFAGDQDARIFVTSAAPRGSNNNMHVGIQHKGCMISQRLPDGYYSRGTSGTRCWVSENGLENLVEEDGWCFVEAAGAYAALRPARGAYEWQEATDEPRDGSHWSGRWMVFADADAPAIIEVARKSDYEDYAAFREALRERPLRWEAKVLHYQSLTGDRFVFPADHSANPTLNGKTLDYFEPDYAFHSPFVQSEWDSGVVRLQFAGERMTLDFTEGSVALEAQLAELREEKEARRLKQAKEEARIEAARPRRSMAWQGPADRYGSISAPENWDGGALPNLTGDLGLITGAGPLRVAMDHGADWEGTLVATGANLDFSNGGLGNGQRVAELRLEDSSLLGVSNQKGDRPMMGEASLVRLEGKNTLSLENQAHDAGWNVWADFSGTGSLWVRSQRRKREQAVQSSLRGKVAGVDLVLQGARLALMGPVHFRSHAGEDSVNQIRGTGSTAVENRLLIYGDFDIGIASLVPPDGETREWQLVDWSQLAPASGWPSDSGVVRTGEKVWNPDGGQPFYNGAGGRRWSLEAEGRVWVFDESQGTLSVRTAAGKGE